MKMKFPYPQQETLFSRRKLTKELRRVDFMYTILGLGQRILASSRRLPTSPSYMPPVSGRAKMGRSLSHSHNHSLREEEEEEEWNP